MSQRRLQILDAAATLMAEKGYVQTSVDDVITQAGLSGKSHFYHYFKSKDALAHEVVARQFDVLAERGLAILRDSSHEPIARLNAFIDSVAAQQASARGKHWSPFGVLALEMVDADDGFRTRIAAVFRSWTDEISAVLGQASDRLAEYAEPRRLARFIVATLEGATTLSRVKRDPTLMQGVAEDLKRFVNGHLRR